MNIIQAAELAIKQGYKTIETLIGSMDLTTWKNQFHIDNLKYSPFNTDWIVEQNRLIEKNFRQPVLIIEIQVAKEKAEESGIDNWQFRSSFPIN